MGWVCIFWQGNFFFYHAIEMLNPIFTPSFGEDAIRLYIYDLSLACQFFWRLKIKSLDTWYYNENLPFSPLLEWRFLLLNKLSPNSVRWKPLWSSIKGNLHNIIMKMHYEKFTHTSLPDPQIFLTCGYIRQQAAEHQKTMKR